MADETNNECGAPSGRELELQAESSPQVEGVEGVQAAQPAEPAVTSPHPDDADDDLANLPPPARRAKVATVVVMVLSALAALATAWALRSDALYAFADDEPLDLGEFATSELGPQHHNRLVRARAVLEARRAVSYRRPGEADRFQISRIHGAPGGERWVDVRVPSRFDGPRFVPPSYLFGRLVRVDALGMRHRGVGEALAALGGPDAAAAAAAGPGGRSWILVQGSEPRNLRWVVALVAMLCGFALWNVLGVARILRRLPAT